MSLEFNRWRGHDRAARFRTQSPTLRSEAQYLVSRFSRSPGPKVSMKLRKIYSGYIPVW